jgi:hypothetical protein
MRKSLIYLLIIIGVVLACEKQNQIFEGNGEVIEFNPEKCSCCWGWKIKIDNDTIKSDDIIIGETVGYEIENPVPVYVEVGKIKWNCSGFPSPNKLYDYYDIKVIHKLKK